MPLWPFAIEVLAPFVVKITTPRGSGTGFFVSSTKTGLCAVATAAHVVDHAHYWDEPLRINHHASGETRLLRPPDRAILLDEGLDTAAIVFRPDNLKVPAELLPLSPEGKFLMAGAEIGWLGFPAIASSTLCFFSGRISSWLDERASYLVDGVAINGVSGGPAFWTMPAQKKPAGLQPTPTLMGVVTAYFPNRATGEALPGLCEIRDVRQFQELTKELKSLDEAKEKETPPPDAPPPPSPEGGATPSRG